MAELNEQQLLLLNSLVYLDADYSPGTSVGAMVDQLLEEGALDNMDIGGGMTKADALDMLQNIANDEALCSLQVDSCVNTEIRGVCFVDPSTDDAVIAFRGTGPAYAAWDDNCQGGYLSDTDMQQEALAFAQDCAQRYDDITVTGHSKGGNMAQYVTVLMGDEVDRCVSFDGQGFGDEFLAKYADEIAANRDKIRSVCAHNDYVNILLTPIAGEIVYLENEADAFPDGHYVYNLYKESENVLDENGEYISVKKQDPLIAGLKGVVNMITARIDLMGFGSSFSEFLSYTIVGILMGQFISGEAKDWDGINWKKILEEVLENLEDYIESGRWGMGDRQGPSVNHSITVTTEALREYSADLDAAAAELETLRGQIKKLQRAMATNIIKGITIGLPLQAVLSQLDSESGKLEKMAYVLRGCADQYDSAETTAKNQAQ